MKTRLYLVFAIIAIIVLYLTVPFTNPALLTGAISLSRPESLIRRDMLNITHIGTSKEDVIEVIEERGWTVRWVRDTSQATTQGRPYESGCHCGLRAAISSFIT